MASRVPNNLPEDGVEPRVFFEPLECGAGAGALSDLEAMIVTGVELLLDLKGKGLYLDPALPVRTPEQGGVPDAGRCPFRLSGRVELVRPERVTLELRIRGAKSDVLWEGRLPFAREDRDGDLSPFRLPELHRAHVQVFRALCRALDLRRRPPEIPPRLLAHRLRHPETQSIEAWRFFCRAVRTRNAPVEKVRLLRRSIRRDPLFGRALRHLGYVLRSQGQHREALDAYRRAAFALVDPLLLGENYFEMGLSAAAQEHYGEAVRHWRRALPFTPHRREAYFNIALAYEEMQDADEAERYYQKARKEDPRYIAALEGLFRIYIQESSYLKAASVLEEWIGITPGDPGLHRIIGHCYRQEGMEDRAQQHLRRAMELDPHGEIGREAKRDLKS